MTHTETLVVKTTVATALAKAKVPRVVATPVVGRVRASGRTVDPKIAPAVDVVLPRAGKVTAQVVTPLDVDPPSAAAATEVAPSAPTEAATVVTGPSMFMFRWTSVLAAPSEPVQAASLSASYVGPVLGRLVPAMPEREAHRATATTVEDGEAI